MYYPPRMNISDVIRSVAIINRRKDLSAAEGLISIIHQLIDSNHLTLIFLSKRIGGAAISMESPLEATIPTGFIRSSLSNDTSSRLHARFTS